ncbi:hypothetical protein KA001_02635 [Patescibacteria group bacterium]|nr:hypothetical protein [Patescibacteria group bacterium]
MSKVVLSEEEKKQFFKDFIVALEQSIKSNKIADFLIDFFSDNEIDAFIKRLEVFKRLNMGQSYSKLNQELSVSPITTSKVSKQLRDSSDSFRALLSDLSDKSTPTKTVQKEVQKQNKRDSYL